MKIIVLHGEDTNKSYERLSKFMETAKLRGWDIITNEFPNTPSLFGTDRLIIYRDYRLLSKSDIKNFDKFDGTLVIYHDGDIPQAFLKMMPKDFKMEKFDLPKILFTFLDSFYPGEADRTLQLLHQLIENTPIELVFFMLSRHLRDLYWAMIDPNIKSIPAWKLSKLKPQASKFGEEKLKQIISNLADIDIAVKSSKADLLTALDLLIVKQLK